jgi:transcriptional regulator with XRE-family HTH domain
MTARLSPKQIGKRIVEWRKLKGYSQEDLAKFLNIPRSSVAQMELGNRNVSVIELIKLSDALGFSLDKFLAEEYKAEKEIEAVASRSSATAKEDMRISVPQLKINKFKNVLLYLLERCGGKPNVGETVLYKLLYFSDFNFYEIYEEHLTGAQYRKLPYGPVPQKFDGLISQMIEKGQLQRIKTEYHGYPQTRYIPLEKSDLTEMTAAEKDVIDRVIDRFSDWTASAVSDYSHKDMPWKATDEGDIIDYELAFYREAPFSVRTYDDEPEQP